MTKRTLAMPGADEFVRRHIGPRPDDIAVMLRTLGYDSLDDLIDAAVPGDIRLTKPIALPAAQSEFAALRDLRAIRVRRASSLRPGAA